MDSSIDALFHELVNHGDSYISDGILSHLLGRQSLTEVDHNRRLKAALKLAMECKAAKLIMLGFHMLPAPSLNEAYTLISDSGGEYQQWRQQEARHMLSDEHLSWAIALAGFKTCYRLALQCTRDRHRSRDYYHHWRFFAKQAIGYLDRAPEDYESHPFVLQGTVQWRMLMEDLDQPLVSHWDAMSDPSVWDSVRGSILATLFMLAKSWDLGSLLAISRQAGDHVLVSFLHEQHSMQRELLLRPAPRHEPTYEKLALGLEEMNSLVEGLPADTRSDEDEECLEAILNSTLDAMDVYFKRAYPSVPRPDQHISKAARQAVFDGG
ncbi:hypothetical protein ABBQ38_000566 [Trebouxia sp. C0009 RCD-2024]